MLVSLLLLASPVDLLQRTHATLTSPPAQLKPKVEQLTAEFVQVLKTAPGSPQLPELATTIATLRTTAGLTVDSTKDKAAAQKAYDAHNYGIALTQFQRLVAKNPTDAAAWADLGVCAFKVGNRSLGLTASRAAVALGDEQTMKNALYNLGKQGAFVTLETTSADEENESAPKSGSVASEPGCSANYSISQVSFARDGCDARYCYEGRSTWLFIGATQEEVDGCAQSLASQLSAEEGSARAIGESVTMPACTRAQLVGGYLVYNEGQLEKCDVVWANACRGQLAVYCNNGTVELLTPAQLP